jgi:hypothetical protein
VPIDKRFYRSPTLKTPLLTKLIHAKHLQNGVETISVYDESIIGDPLKCTVKTRWYLNRPSFLSGKLKNNRRKRSLHFVYAHEIDKKLPRLHVNTIDFDFFLSAPSFEERPLRLFYGGKLHSLGIFVEKPKNVIEIQRSGPLKQSREELRELFSRANIFYVAEDTAMVLEAAICGCSSIHLAQYFTKPPLSQQDGGVGLVESEGEGLTYSREFIERYISTLKLRELCDLSKFILQTQNSLKNSPSWNKPKYRLGRLAILKIQFFKAKAGFQASGLNGVLAVIYSHRQLSKDED